jgi:ATP-dependent DNA helicase RecG
MGAELYDRKRNYFTERKMFPYVNENMLRISELMPKVRNMAQLRKADHPWISMTDMEIMRSADLYEIDPVTGKEGYNLAAVLLFGKDETIFSCCPGYITDCILRRENVDRYDDRLMVTTNLIEAYGQVLGFIQKLTPDPFYLEGVQAVSIRDKIAREIISNILCHREFSSTIPARIVIEDNQIVADNWNRSNLYGKLNPKTFTPNPKNPILARFFVNINYADVLGSGMRNLYKYTPIYANGKEPELIEGDIFKTIIPLPEFFARNGQANVQINVQLNVQLNETERKVLDLLSKNPYITLDEVALQISRTIKTAHRNVKSLCDKDIIRRVGAKKDGHWEIISTEQKLCKILNPWDISST